MFDEKKSLKRTIFFNTLFFLIIMFLLAGVGICFFNWSRSSEKRVSNSCYSADDCVLFGETGECNCGCYLKGNLPTSTGGECFCLAPTACVCDEGECVGVFDEPVSEESQDSYCQGMSLEEARRIASESECGDKFASYFMCNEFTNTWWLDLNLKKEGCNPACVINAQTGEAEINWRCTGLK